MMYIFNHGVNSSELFTNYFKSKFNVIGLLKKDAVKIFDTSFHLILNDVIENKVRFAIPGPGGSYIDFKVFKDKTFEYHRSIGRFQDVDFIESEFMGYQMIYYVKRKAYFQDIPIYLGSELREKFLDKTNNGEKFYTKDTKRLVDYLPMICELYPDIKESDLKRLLTFVFSRMNDVIKLQGAISIKSNYYPRLTLHIGIVRKNPLKQIAMFNKCHILKARFLYRWNKPEFDGYYYTAVIKPFMDDFINLNKNAVVRLTFNNAYFKKVKEELYYNSSEVYIFRVKHKKDIYCLWKKKWYVRDPEYFGKAVKGHFKRATITWKQLIKEYETGISK